MLQVHAIQGLDGNYSFQFYSKVTTVLDQQAGMSEETQARNYSVQI